MLGSPGPVQSTRLDVPFISAFATSMQERGGEKFCTGCADTLPTFKFSLDSGTADGFYHRCKSCKFARDKQARKLERQRQQEMPSPPVSPSDSQVLAKSHGVIPVWSPLCLRSDCRPSLYCCPNGAAVCGGVGTII